MKYKIFVVVFLAIVFFLVVYINPVYALTPEEASMPSSFRDAVGDDVLYNKILELPEATSEYYYKYRGGTSGFIGFIKKSAYPDLKFRIEFSDFSTSVNIFSSTTDVIEGALAFYNINTETGEITKADNNPLVYSTISTQNGVLNFYTNVPVYKEEGNHGWGELFFFTEKTLMEVVQWEKTTMKGILQEIILILPMILVVVVSCLGLLKALRMLSTLLHRA